MPEGNRETDVRDLESISNMKDNEQILTMSMIMNVIPLMPGTGPTVLAFLSAFSFVVHTRTTRTG